MLLVSRIQNRLVVTFTERGEDTVCQTLDRGGPRWNRLILDLLQSQLTEEHPWPDV